MPRASKGTSTFSWTVSHGKRAKLWNTIATLDLEPDNGLPCLRTSPLEGVVSPESIRKSVDLPEPEGPSRATIIPDSSQRSVGAITWTRPPPGRWKLFSIRRPSMIVAAGGGTRAHGESVLIGGRV